MKATIQHTHTHYYVLKMGEREIGGKNKQYLTEYARDNGYTEIEYIPLKPEPKYKVFNTIRGWD
jgi:hypothetical protein